MTLRLVPVDWRLRGACRGLGNDAFFHPDGERGGRRTQREARAKAICRCCPVIVECRAYALAAREPYGVWGGLSRADRELIITRSAWAPRPDVVSGAGQS